MLARLGGQGRVALGAILGAVVAALCCFGVLTSPSGDAAHADETGVPQAVSGVSAAAGHLAQPIAGVAVQGAVSVPVTTTPPPTTTTRAQPPPVTTTRVPTTTTTTVPKPTVPTTLPTFPHEPVPTFPHRHHCRWGGC